MLSRKILFTSFCFFAFHFHTINGAKILFYFGIGSYSHRVSVWPLAEALAEKGHNVTFFFTMPPKITNPKITEFGANNMTDYNKRAGTGSFDVVKMRIKLGPTMAKKIWGKFVAMGVKQCEILLTDPNAVEWIKKSQFDLLIINSLFNDCALGLAHQFRAPFILFGTSSPFGWLPDDFGYPDEASYIPDLRQAYKFDMDFLTRVSNAIEPLLWQNLKEQDLFLPIEKLFKKHLGVNDLPPLREIQKNASLIFSYRDPLDDVARSLPPIFVSVPGLHISEKSKPLPSEMAKFLNDGESDDFIFASFGSMASFSSLSEDHIKAFLEVFREFKNLKFLWKWEAEAPKNLPSNVFVSSWFPQRDIFAHPKIKGFVSHGGTLSFQEAIYYGVPLVVIPFFADQDYNANVVEFKKLGISIDVMDLNFEVLKTTISEITTNQMYKENADKASKQFQDRIMKPLDAAIWWTEYVLRNKESKSFRSLGMSQTWYQRRNIDVWIFLFVTALSTVLFSGIVLWKCGCILVRLRKPVAITRAKKVK